MVTGVAMPVCSGKKSVLIHKAKDAKLANKMLPEEFDELSLTHKNAVDNILAKIDELGLKLADALSEYHKTKKDFESQTKKQK